MDRANLKVELEDEALRAYKGMMGMEPTMGALDGRHCTLQNPCKSEATYDNYKGHSSIILMCMVDAKYRFKWVEVGPNGACSEAQK